MYKFIRLAYSHPLLLECIRIATRNSKEVLQNFWQYIDTYLLNPSDLEEKNLLHRNMHIARNIACKHVKRWP